MTTFDQSVWRCDRCRLELILERRAAPRKWSGCAVFDSPLGSEPLDAGDRFGARRHLCGECSDALRAFLRGDNVLGVEALS